MSTSQIALLASVQQFLDRQHGLYIDGAPCAAQSENRLTVWDPATGQAIATTADASPADVDRAVMSAWRAFVDRRWAGRWTFRSRSPKGRVTRRGPKKSRSGWWRASSRGISR